MTQIKNLLDYEHALPKLAGSLDRIFQTVQQNGLRGESSPSLEEDISFVSSHFGIPRNGAVLLAHITEHNTGGGSEEDELARFVGCSNISFMGFKSALDELVSRGIVMQSLRNFHQHCYFLSREASKAIERGTKFEPVPLKGLSADTFFARLRHFFADFNKDLVDTELLLNNIHRLIEDNPHLQFCRRVQEQDLINGYSFCEQIIFFYLCHRRVNFGDECVPIDRLFHLTEYIEDLQLLRRRFTNEKTSLQRTGLVIFGGEQGFQDPDSLSLTDKTVKTFLDEVSTFSRQSEFKGKDIILASSIVKRDLYYNSREAAQMERLAELLNPNHFKGIQLRLEETGMRKGFAVLFCGGAGCGKTAGAYELARRTGRDILAVNMAAIKNKWVGDSEKNMKALFDRYRTMCRRLERTPILLFNEADAIFSKRIENPSDSVDQMMNSIQNICLEAMENLEGILIATTNLAGNFCDEAFARRFIFKVEFSTPEAEIRAKIWKSMIKDLSDEDAQDLADHYTFSGGNIENIARKVAINYVLSGSKARIEELRRYCDEEKIGGVRNRIGFR